MDVQHSTRRSLRPLRLLALVIALVASIAQAALAARPAPAQAQSGWRLVWGDEFSGSGQPNPANWNYHVGNGWNNGAGGFLGWGNGEWEWYRPENCYLSGGKLVMRADYTTTPTNIAGRDWYQRSCRITTDTKRSLTYGAVEARIQMPSNIGTWPAFWMMGDACDDTSTSNYAAPIAYYDTMATNWSSCGEIDIMEHKNTESQVYQNLFWDTRTGLFPWADGLNANNPTTYNVGSVATFHTYRLEWTATQLRWLIDGKVAKTEDITPANMEEFHKPFHIILNLALGGAFTGYAEPNQAEFPLYMYVDYVRVYQAGASATPTRTPTAPPTPTATPSGAAFTQGVESVSATQARVWFKPNGWAAGYVILHYIRPGLGQQNLHMAYNSAAARWEYTVDGMAAGQTLQTQFTYQRDGLQYDTGWYSWTKP